MSDLTNQKKIIKLIATELGAMDKVLDSRINRAHFIDSLGSRESKILSKIFELAVDYFQNSGGSLLTHEVFNARVADSNLTNEQKSDFVSVWMDIHKEEPTIDDLYHTITEIKHEYASKLLEGALSNLQENLLDKGIKPATNSMIAELNAVYDQFIEIDTERTRFDITERATKFEEEYLYRKQNKDKFTGVPSGIPDIDEETGGFMPGQLIVWLAPTGGGTITYPLPKPL